jgi:signal transduction histidine kinase
VAGPLPARDDDGMPFLGVLLAYTIFVLLAERVARKAWRRVRERGPGTPLVQVPRLRDIGWGAALVPVTVLFLWASGTFGITRPGGSSSDNLFGTATLTGSVWLSLLIVAIVGGYTLLRPRRASYLAAVGVTAIGAWVLLVALAFPHYTYDYEWYGWLRDQLYFPELALLGMACLAGGFFLTRRTILADVRASRAGLTARVERLTQTRAEAVDSAAAELRRLERDLHDGAQARLVALGINLRTAEKMIEASPAAAAALVADCRATATLALSELRGLVRGIYPPVLADRGVGDAIKALALDCPVLTLTDIELDGRPPAPVESAVYFAVAEVLSNAVKHAEARAISIRVTHASGMLRAEVDDDGIGGADPSGGTGLAGIERRLAAFDGILAISSPAGGPTIVVIEVPCALSSPKTSTC